MNRFKNVREHQFLRYVILLVCLLPLVFPQVVHAAPTDDITLTVEQTFIKPAGSTAADTFTYTLTAQQAGNPMPVGSSGGTCTFTMSDTETISVGPITYHTAGTYSYEIKQVTAPAQTGYTYDSQVYTLWVYVTNTAGDIQADAVIHHDNGGKVSTIAFTNSYAPLASDPSIMVDPPVKKTVSGNPGVDGTFTFQLEAADPANPMPAGSANGIKLMTIIGPGEEDFGTWIYTKAGIYEYTISEVNNGEAGYTYDTTVYTIRDEVKDVNGQLTVDRTVTNASNTPVEAYAFVNEYTADKKAGGTTGGNGKTNGITKGPKTGDDAMVELYRALFLVGGMVLISFCAYRLITKRRREEKIGNYRNQKV